ncbi:MAG TPA: hypothetical protein EYP19_09580 [Desulfobacterales bacterium]|nr:hypothetical protein [Desulfobacterales bacterium]
MKRSLLFRHNFPRTIVTVVLLWIAFWGSSHAEGSNRLLRVAVSNLEHRGLSGQDALVLSDTLQAALHETGKVKLLNRSDMKRILTEHELNMSGLVDDKTLIAAGQALGVEKMVTGSVNRIGKSYLLCLRLVDLKSFANDKIVELRIRGSKDLLVEGTKIGAYKLMGLQPPDLGRDVGGVIKEIGLFEKILCYWYVPLLVLIGLAGIFVIFALVSSRRDKADKKGRTQRLDTVLCVEELINEVNGLDGDALPHRDLLNKLGVLLHRVRYMTPSGPNAAAIRQREDEIYKGIDKLKTGVDQLKHEKDASGNNPAHLMTRIVDTILMQIDQRERLMLR